MTTFRRILVVLVDLGGDFVGVAGFGGVILVVLVDLGVEFSGFARFVG